MRSDAWAHKWMNTAKTSVMFSNKYVNSNIIYSVDDLLKAMEEKDRAYRLVPLGVIQKVLYEKTSICLKQKFRVANAVQ